MARVISPARISDERADGDRYHVQSCPLISRDVIRAQPRLSIHDGFAFALAEVNRGCILLTGDSSLRALAEASQIEVHGVLWVFDQIFTRELATAETLHAALSQLAADPAVRLPKRDVAAYIKRYEGSK